MRINNLNDLLVDQIKDCWSFEDQFQTALQKWSAQTDHEDLKRMFKNQLSWIDSNKEALQSMSDTLGIDPTGELCQGTQGIIKEGNQFLSEATDADAKDAGLIAMVQRLEHYGMAAYGCARTYALHLDQNDLAEGLQEILDQKGEVDEQLTELAESRLNLEAVAG